MRIFVIFFVFIITVRLFVGCSDNINMAFEEIRYVDKFSQTFDLNNEVEVDLENLNIIGVKDFSVYDSLLIFATTDKEGFWSFVSLPDYRFLGKFLKQGQGPYEFFSFPYIGSGAKLFKEIEAICAVIYNSQKGELYKMNIDESIKNNRLNIYTMDKNLQPFLFNFVLIDSITFLCKEISNGETQQIRYLLVDGKKIIPNHFEKLNSAKIRKGEDVNILSTITRYDSGRNRIIEMPVGLNFINMYSIDGSIKKTICIGKQLNDIMEIQNIMRGKRIYTFANLRLFPKLWGVVYINEDYGTNGSQRKRLPNILLFDWNGEPLAQLNLNNFITSFDIDFINGVLYTLDAQTDVFCKYDIQDILNKL